MKQANKQEATANALIKADENKEKAVRALQEGKPEEARKLVVTAEKIENKVYIYFDFNEPIITNNAVTFFKSRKIFGGEELVPYPNPVENEIEYTAAFAQLVALESARRSLHDLALGSL